MSFLTRIVLTGVLTIGLLWLITTYLPQYLTIAPGPGSLVIVGAFLTILNLIARPLFELLAAPISLLSGLLPVLIVNTILLWMLSTAASMLDPAIGVFAIHGGIVGFVIIAFCLGIGHWIIRMLVR